MILHVLYVQIQRLSIALPPLPSILPVLVLIIAIVSLFLILFVFRSISFSLPSELLRTLAFTFRGVRSRDQVVSKRWRACRAAAKFPHLSILLIVDSLDLLPPKW